MTSLKMRFREIQNDLALISWAIARGHITKLTVETLDQCITKVNQLANDLMEAKP